MKRRALLVVLLYSCATSISAVFLSAFIAQNYTRHFLERIHWDDAAELVSVRPVGTAEFFLGNALERGRVILPQFDFYVLDIDGHIIYPHVAQGVAVDTAPLKRMLLNPPPAQVLYGSIPGNSAARAIFSVAEFKERAEVRYLYLVHKFARTWEWNDFLPTLRNLARPILIGFAGSALIFILLILYLSHSFRQLASAIAAYGRGKYDWPISFPRGNELIAIASRVSSIAQVAGNQERELIERSTFRQELLEDLVHDMRGPLAAARGFVDSLLGNLQSMPKEFRSRCFAGTSASFVALQKLSQQLKTASSEELPIGRLQPECIDLSSFLSKIEQSYAVIAQTKNVDFILEYATELRTIDIDPFLLERALNNLIENALKYTPSGGVIRLSAQTTADGVRISVADSGPGIANEKLLRIFERFYRSEDSAQPKGYGLGLATVRRAAELHGGTASATSSEGQGSTFSIVLPASRRQTVFLIDEPRPPSSEPASASRSRTLCIDLIKVLLVLVGSFAFYFVCKDSDGTPVTLVSCLGGIIFGYIFFTAVKSPAAMLALVSFPFALFLAEAVRTPLTILLTFVCVGIGSFVRLGTSRRIKLRFSTRTFLLLVATLFFTSGFSAFQLFSACERISLDLDLPHPEESARRILDYLSISPPNGGGIQLEQQQLSDRLGEFARLNRTWNFYLTTLQNELLDFASWNEYRHEALGIAAPPTDAPHGYFTATVTKGPRSKFSAISYARGGSVDNPLSLYIDVDNHNFSTTFVKMSQPYIFAYLVLTLVNGICVTYAVARVINAQLERLLKGIEREISRYGAPPEVDASTPESETVSAVRTLIRTVQSRSESIRRDDAFTRQLVSSILLEIDQRDRAAIHLLQIAENAGENTPDESTQRALLLLRGVLKYQTDFLDDVLVSATPSREARTTLGNLAEIAEECVLEAARSGEGCIFISSIEDDIEIVCNVNLLRRMLEHICRLTALRGASVAEFKTTRVGKHIQLTLHTDERPQLDDGERIAVFAFLSAQFAQALHLQLVREVDPDEQVQYRCQVA